MSGPDHEPGFPDAPGALFVFLLSFLLDIFFGSGILSVDVPVS